MGRGGFGRKFPSLSIWRELLGGEKGKGGGSEGGSKSEFSGGGEWRPSLRKKEFPW